MKYQTLSNRIFWEKCESIFENDVYSKCFSFLTVDKWAASREKLLSSLPKMCGITSSCACAWSHPGLCSPIIHFIVSNDSSSGQGRPWSDCASTWRDSDVTYWPVLWENAFWKRLFKYTKNFITKNWKFSDKTSDIFHISAQNIDCGYSLEPPHRGSSNEYPHSTRLSRNKKNNVYPCKHQFYCIKVGFKGVKTI